MTQSPFQFATRLDAALEKLFYPDIEWVFEQDFEGAIAHIHDTEKPEYITNVLLERKTPILARAVLRLLQLAPDTLSLRLLNQTVDITTTLYNSSDAAEHFPVECGRTLYDELNHFTSTNPGASVREYLTRLLYRTMFQKAPESRQWIRDNFLSYDPMDLTSMSQSLGRIDGRMLIIMNYIGLDNQLIRDRAREVLDVQLAQGAADAQLVLLLSGQPEFDMTYLAKVAEHYYKPNEPRVMMQQSNNNHLRVLGDALIANAQVDQVEDIGLCIKAIAGMDPSLLPGRSGGDLLLDFIQHTSTNNSKRHAALYQRNILTAEQIGPRLNTNKELDFAVRHSNFKLLDLLPHAPETVQAGRLERDIGL
ncbi:hypothetical protein DV532_27825 (plasmid) [Pseudomonas sp. Leaf58]|uniref:hypothetical protein n=1 Tax=Pseudomonas sp. Leaf58 TaxID=1736226 RepID=UPI0006F34DD2|nr:hypothetical protein [Pseudomonas sp. Leaf58]AYG48091.1 hypothetical protein DV532_27825 [Pseudomonas sp. Leaf58]KQN62354.1 hypothetical protein ASF02_09390 [Pseudomonas sp. Leaf58]